MGMKQFKMNYLKSFFLNRNKQKMLMNLRKVQFIKLNEKNFHFWFHINTVLKTVQPKISFSNYENICDLDISVEKQ